MLRGEHRIGALARGARVSGTVVLRPRAEDALKRFIATVTDSRSKRFGDYLGRGRFAASFGPSSATRASVIAALRAGGLRVGRASADGLLIPFTGRADAVQRTFATTLDSVRLPNGRTAHATGAPVSLPSNVAGEVVAVLGLDDTVLPHRIGSSPTIPGAAPGRHTLTADQSAVTGAAAATAPVACPEATATAIHDNGLTDTQLADAYGAGQLYQQGDDGSGQRIAVYELEPFLRADLAHFDACYFGTAQAASMLRRLHVHEVGGGQPDGTGTGEANLDVEDLSALAPGAAIDVYVAPQPDALQEYAAIIDSDRDRVITTSWGECEQAAQVGDRGLQQAENLLFEQAAAQGQTVVAAAGDSGSDDCAGGATPSPGANPLSVDDPASQPYVVGVGGTAIDDTGATGSSGPPLEHAWNDGTAYGAGGGGISNSWTMPAWQRTARVPGIALPGSGVYRDADRLEAETGFAGGFCDSATHAEGPCRLVPDVSAQADEFTGGITVYSRAYRSPHDPSGWTTTGGTSSAAPIWAASLTLINASAACSQSTRTRDGVGFAAPLLYAVASDPAAYAASFTDVRTGNNDVYGLENGRVFQAGRGYDLATGLGSPQLAGADQAPGLASYLCAAAAASSAPSVRSLTPAEGSARGDGRLVVHGSGFTAAGRSQVASVQVGTRRIGAGAIQVRGAHTLSLRLPSAAAATPPKTSGAERGYGSVEVIVTLRNGESSAGGPRALFRYVARRGHATLPTVGMLAPYGGPARGGGAVTILGSGFHDVTAVTFGGVPATGVRVDGEDRITALPPARGSRTLCSPLPHRGVYRHENEHNDVCQVQVRVHEHGRVSAAATIRAPLEGPQLKDAFGDLRAYRGCHCETAPASDEYDYLPRPRIASVTIGGGGAEASEHGGTLAVIRGAGLNSLDLEWADIGNPHSFTSERTSYLYATGTELVLRVPARPVTADRLVVRFSVRSLSGQSNARPLTYAGVPVVTSVVNTRNARNLNGLYGGPDTGQTPLAIHGRGMSGQVIGLEFVGRGTRSFSFGTQYRARPRGDRLLDADTVAENPGVVAVEPCTVTGCATAGAHNQFWLYPQGTPQVSAVTPDSGPAAGGTVTEISGANLSCPLSVQFGGATAPSVTSVKTILGCGSAQSLAATAPPGIAGQTVPVTVQTAESFYTGSAPQSVASFTYR
ncbi:MAG TPA: protease pro-enzyme activation domain-containing protein [Solirubrobacteraceae bacterium]|nr:protease pro-enzyme activation domain-containing protein [Solirubrobacteraceae bacterium]